ncbi:T9SS type A sorting domain-containing protein [Jejuia pallidilutea]|uniref:T9SS type A sorting domain-containing protein n=1 Tax=Jejuia pallidilutea TaxID=504487 RepID=UPI0021CD4197|nr:T9SS type A sorting domain-containing protein [Jejuia pallidilutea]
MQGKSINSINDSEIIKLGLSTNIEAATIYKISIAQLEGDFLSNNTIYLKDKLTNTIHNLSNGDYSFTSEVGEFNERFEIAFNAASLSNDAFALNNNAVKIVQLDNNNVKFTTETSTFKSITVFDLLGRALQTFNGDSNNETYNLSTLKNSVYIANIELQNGATLSKKFIKK